MTRQEALLEAVQPLRQADFAQVKETMELFNYPTQTTTVIKRVIANLVEYFQHEKDYPLQEIANQSVNLNSASKQGIDKRGK